MNALNTKSLHVLHLMAHHMTYQQRDSVLAMQRRQRLMQLLASPLGELLMPQPLPKQQRFHQEHQQQEYLEIQILVPKRTMHDLPPYWPIKLSKSIKMEMSLIIVMDL